MCLFKEEKMMPLGIFRMLFPRQPEATFWEIPQLLRAANAALLLSPISMKSPYFTFQIYTSFKWADKH
jgi:hypothetical protein